jgi:hypothetical protein
MVSEINEALAECKLFVIIYETEDTFKIIKPVI